MKIQHSHIEYLREYAEHLKNLADEDRYTRFGFAASSATIDSMILNILYHQDDHHIFTYYTDSHIVGFGHLAREGDAWELAVSVEKEYQGQGIANELMDHMIAWGKTHGVEVLYMHCITENQKIQHLARKHGLKSWDRAGHELTSRVQLPDATPLDYTAQFLREQREIVEKIANLQRRMFYNFNPLNYSHRHDI
jgi:GNAT superfamily N-acetyltransferase